MKKVKVWMAGLTIVSLLAIGLVAVAGNGFGTSTGWNSTQAATGNCSLYERDADGDGILNADDADWVRPLDGSGYGAGQGFGANAGQGIGGQQLGDRPMDGTGYGANQGHGMGQGLRDGSCL
jgi:hypothetical protein